MVSKSKIAFGNSLIPMVFFFEKARFNERIWKAFQDNLRIGWRRVILQLRFQVEEHIIGHRFCGSAAAAAQGAY